MSLDHNTNLSLKFVCLPELHTLRGEKLTWQVRAAEQSAMRRGLEARLMT